jgi:tetratricopeptide (TPR) repeat protein
MSHIAPNECETQLLTDIAAAMRAGNSARASELADIALSRGLKHPLPYQARAVQLDQLGYGQQAIENFLKARALVPDDPMIANGIAICLGRMGRLKEAIAIFEAAVELDPALLTTYLHLGSAHEMNRDFAAAGDVYKRALALAPEHAAPWAGLAVAEEGRQNWKDAIAAANTALAINPRQPRVILALASAEIHEGFFAAAETRLSAAMPDFVPAHLKIAALGLLADTLDGQDKTKEAFEYYTAENSERRAHYLPPSPPLDLAKLIRTVTSHFESTYPAQWTLEADESQQKPREHVFLMGFPRSGTTLLEQILSAHPDVVTLEESDVLDAPAEKFLRDRPGLDRLAALGADALLQERLDYWTRVGAHGVDVAARIFVDKLPLNTIKLPLIAKLFPNAKVVFAVRDPRDTVFSCFRRHFQVNASTCEFLDLGAAARFYDSVMTLGELCRKRLPLPFHLYRHEDLVKDFQGEMRRLCDFTGIAWTDRFHDYARIARKRDIRSISAAQVRRGLNDDGIGQWRRYAEQIAPIRAILQPWVEKFGYSS